MAALSNVNTDFFGSAGMSDPIYYKPGTIAFNRTVDFGASPVEAGDNYAFLAVPESFVATGVLVRELEQCDATTVGVSLESDSTALASAQAVGGATLAKAYTALASVVRNSGDMVCVTPTADITKGKLEVTVFGILPAGDSKDNFTLPSGYRVATQSQDNVAAEDPYLTRLTK